MKIKKLITTIITLTMLIGIATPVASAWQQAPANNPFTDVQPHQWHHSYISWAYANGITSGTTPTTFRPNGNVTREMFATFLHRIAGQPSPGTTGRFNDQHTISGWATPAVNWAVGERVIQGFTDNTFRPRQSISREQIVTMLFRYISDLNLHELPPVSEMNSFLNNFHDRNAISSWAIEGVRWAAYYGIIGTGGTLNPGGNASRAETVAMLRRVVENFITGTPTPAPPPPIGLTPGANEFEAEVFRLVNIERTNRGLHPLHWHTGIGQVSRAFSKDMSDRNFFSHTCPSGTSPSDRVRAAGIVCAGLFGENLAWGHQTPQQVVSTWMDSPGHKANILSRSYTHLGVGFYNFRWTQKFMDLPGVDRLINHPITNDRNEWAVRTAGIFLETDYHFGDRGTSRRELIHRLMNLHFWGSGGASTSGFTQAEAEFAAENSGINWNQQAVYAIRRLRNMNEFGMAHHGISSLASRNRHINALVALGFLQAEAEYGVDNSSINWIHHAIRIAQNALQSPILQNFSRNALISWMTDSERQFTQAEAEYAADAVGLNAYSE